MKSRQEIKALAKQAMAQQRGTSILILVLLFLVIVAIALFVLIPIPIVGYVIYTAGLILVMPLVVNVEGAFLKIYQGETVTVGEPFSELGVNYARKLGGMWWMMLFYWLWSMLLFVPGFIKLIAYSMTPFILASCPDVPAKRALKLSMIMTKGHKGKLFVLMLSFIGWMLLAGLTIGILGIVHVGPYYYTSYAGFYAELRDNAIASGLIDPAELGMAAAGNSTLPV